MAVPEVDVDESGREVEDPPLARVEPRPLGTRDDDLLDSALRGPRHQDVARGVLRDGGRVRGAFRGNGHAAESSPRKRAAPGAYLRGPPARFRSFPRAGTCPV